MSRHTGYPGGFPFGCWRGMIMEDDHDLDLKIFPETIPIAIGKFLAATSCSYLQQPSLSPSPHLPKSQVPSPKSQVPSPKSRRLWMPWCRWSPLVLHQQPGPHSFMLPHRSTGCPLCPTGVLMDPVAAVLWKLIGCSLVLRRLKSICSSPGVKSTCTF